MQTEIRIVLFVRFLYGHFLSQLELLVSMTVGRRQALWKPSVLDGKIPPLFAGAELFDDPDADLPPTTGSQEVLAAYLATGLTLREHPLTFLRPRLKGRRVITAAELKRTPHGKTVLVGWTGVIPPASANGKGNNLRDDRR